MTGLVARTGLSVRLVRTGIEATVLAVGWMMGGTVGIGTLVYAFGIGPLVQLFLRLTPRSLLFHDFSGGRARSGPRPGHYDERVASGERTDSTISDDGDGTDPDLLIDFARVSLRRGGSTLVGPITWTVELDERWVVIGPNGAGKTSLLRIAAATEHPSSGTAYVLGERLGRTDMAELRARVGLSSSALSQRIPDSEVVRDLVVSAGYAVLGRWREDYEDVDYAQAVDMLESVGAEHLAERTYGTLSKANANAS